MDFSIQRKRMVEEQILARGIKDPGVLKAFLGVPRHVFVPPPYTVSSYADQPLPVGYGQTISQPYIVALMTEALELKGAEKVLEVGTGSGYQAAILSKLCDTVYTIEREVKLLERAKQVISEHGYENIVFACGDGTKGMEAKAPFDAIIVTAAAPYIPEALKEQLADGGRLVIPVGEKHGQMMVVIKRDGEKFIQENLCGCVFVPLIGEFGWKE